MSRAKTGPTAGIVVFPGSNCDQDCYDAVTRYLGQKAVFLWHQEEDLQGADWIILPGGFSYGDALRAGSVARFAPIMQAVKAHAEAGKPVLGICNGFQILTESGLLPGALTQNQQKKFVCRRDTPIVIENAQTLYTNTYHAQEMIHLPVAHAEGNYIAPPDVLKDLERNQQIVFRYAEDINGSMNRIAGICNKPGNVLGLMPHPERNLWPVEGVWSGDGARLFDAVAAHLLGLPIVTTAAA